MLYYKMEEIAKELEYKFIIGEWSQEDNNYQIPKKLAKSLGFRDMIDEYYENTSYEFKNRINYIKYLQLNQNFPK